MVDIVGLLQNPGFMMAASSLFQNPADRQAIQGISQMQLQLQQFDQKRKKEEADQELLDLRRQTLQHELGQSQRRASVSQQLGGLLATPGFDQNQALGLMAQIDPMGAARSAGIGARPQQRRIMQDPRGIPRYIDDAAEVFPGIAPPPPAAGKPGPLPFEGLSKRGQEGWMQAALARAELKRQRGEPLTDEERIAVQTATHSLTQPRLMTGPSGERYEYVPGLPPYAQQNAVGPAGLMGGADQALPSAPPAAGSLLQPPQVPQGVLGGQDVSRGTVRQVMPGKRQTQIAQAVEQSGGTIESIINLMDEAAAEGDTITGAMGAAKASGAGSIARQFGIPVSTRPEQLQRYLGTLKGQAKKLLSGETGSNFSDKDARDLEKIIPQLDWKMDEAALRRAMYDIILILQRYQ